jgi:hypothetical protein
VAAAGRGKARSHVFQCCLQARSARLAEACADPKQAGRQAGRLLRLIGDATAEQKCKMQR